MDGELVKRLKAGGINAQPSGVGDAVKGKHDAAVLSHTLEHIYDITAMFKRISTCVKTGGLLFIEIPVHLFDNYQPPKAYDYHWQHINKFRPRDIEAVLNSHGFSVIISTQIDDYWEYNVWRIVGRKK
jgi:hypothetical protein